MSGVDPRHRPPLAAAYGETFADVYDDWYAGVTDAEATADFVAEEAGAGAVLELGVGTGRLAGPLLDRGRTVIGVDASASMLARCRAQVPATADRLQLVLADMATLPFRPEPGSIGAALIGFNTLFNVPSARGQGRVLAQLAPLLGPDGVVVIEAFDPAGLATSTATPGGEIGVRSRRADGLSVVATVVDPVAQTISGSHLDLDDHGVEARPWFLRWSTPREIDALAAGAGLRLDARFGGWDRRPFTEHSEVHVSAYRPG